MDYIFELGSFCLKTQTFKKQPLVVFNSLLIVPCCVLWQQLELTKIKSMPPMNSFISPKERKTESGRYKGLSGFSFHS